MMKTLLVCFFSFLPFLGQAQTQTAANNQNFENLNCHCPTCIASHPGWAVACGLENKQGKNAPSIGASETNVPHTDIAK